MFEPFQQFVKKAASHYGISKEVQAATICQQFRALMPELFKDRKAAMDHIKPGYFKDGTLVIEVENPAWSQEVIIRKSKIIEEMNKIAGENFVKFVRTQLKESDPQISA